MNNAGYMRENPLDIRQMVITQDAEFRITNSIVIDHKVHIVLKSNLNTAVLCFLFDKRGVKIDNKLYDPSHDPYITFDVPSTRTLYRVQCSAFNDQNKGMLSSCC